MTALAPVAAQATTSVSKRGGRSGSRGASGPVAWMVLPALLVFLGFGVIPLLGALGLSFTTWDGIGAIHPSGLTSWRATLRDPGLPHAVYVTFLIMALSWVFQTPMSLLLGVFLAGRQRYRAALAVVYFVVSSRKTPRPGLP